MMKNRIRKMTMKVRVWIVALAGLLMMSVAVPFSASAQTTRETISKGDSTDRLYSLWNEMKSHQIKIYIEHTGLFVEQWQYFYGREIIGVDETTGTFILSPWKRLSSDKYVFNHDNKEFYIPGDYVVFGFSVDIALGTDWPYSAMFWNDPYTKVNNIEIDVSGFVRMVSVSIWVDSLNVYHNENCDSHSPWNPL